jgi:hypothetical protein
MGADSSDHSDSSSYSLARAPGAACPQPRREGASAVISKHTGARVLTHQLDPACS